MDAGRELLATAGLPEADSAAILAPLLRSVADNVERLGLPDALTGPVRRGDVSTVRSHLDRLAQHAPELRDLYVALSLRQLGLAEELREAKVEALRELGRVLRDADI